MENELENNLIMFFLKQFIKIIRQILQIKKLNENAIEKKSNFINYLK